MLWFCPSGYLGNPHGLFNLNGLNNSCGRRLRVNPPLWTQTHRSPWGVFPLCGLGVFTRTLFLTVSSGASCVLSSFESLLPSSLRWSSSFGMLGALTITGDFFLFVCFSRQQLPAAVCTYCKCHAYCKWASFRKAKATVWFAPSLVHVTQLDVDFCDRLVSI